MDNRKFFLLINVALAALILWMAIRVAFNWFMEIPGDRIQSSEGNSKGARQETALLKPKPLRHFDPIIRHNIFVGSGSASGLPRKVEGITATTLALTLKGTAVGQGQKSYAVILDQRTRKQGLFPVHSVIQGARIKKIRQDRVILTLGTQTQALLLSPERKNANGDNSAQGAGSGQIGTRVKGRVSSVPKSSSTQISKPPHKIMHGIRLSGKQPLQNPHGKQ